MAMVVGEKYWEKSRFSQAEKQYYELLSQETTKSKQSLLVSEIAKAREHIQNSLQQMNGIACSEATMLSSNIVERVQLLEEENSKLKDLVNKLNEMCLDSQKRIASLEAGYGKQEPVKTKSRLVLDVKPWDDKTDLEEMENTIRKISADGLLWGASKLIPVDFGIKKLSISCVVEDDKVSIDWLIEEIEKNEDFVQSVDKRFNEI